MNWLPVWNGVPLYVPQFDGSRFASENCTMAAAAMLAFVSSGGTKRVTGAQVRTLSGDANQPGTEFESPGTNLGSVERALSKLGIRVENKFRMPYSVFREKLTNRSAVVPGYYSFVPRKYRLQDSGWGDHSPHSVFVYEYNPQRDAYWVIDPLSKNKRDYQGMWWPSDVMKAFAYSDYGLMNGRLWGNASFQTENIGVARPPAPFVGLDNPIDLPSTGTDTVPKSITDIWSWAGLIDNVTKNLGIKKDDPLNSTQLFYLATWIGRLLHPGDGATEWQGFASDLLGMTENGYNSKYRPDPILKPYLDKINNGQTVTLGDIIADNPAVTQQDAPGSNDPINAAVETFRSIVDLENWLFVGAMGLGLLMAAYGLNMVLNAGGSR